MTYQMRHPPKLADSTPAYPIIRHPDDLPDLYAMICSGDCLAPEIPDGSILKFCKSEPYKVGDFCIFISRPELVPAGACQSIIKRLVVHHGPGVTFPWREHPDSKVHACVIAEQLNPARRYMIKCERLIAIHKCLGIVPASETDLSPAQADAIRAGAKKPRRQRRAA